MLSESEKFVLLEFIGGFLPSINELYGFIMFLIIAAGFARIVLMSKKYRYLLDYICRFF